MTSVIDGIISIKDERTKLSCNKLNVTIIPYISIKRKDTKETKKFTTFEKNFVPFIKFEKNDGHMV